MRVISIIRKPMKGSVAVNCVNHGCGALNIDACRISQNTPEIGGRWPANIILHHNAVSKLETQSGLVGGGSLRVNSDESSSNTHEGYRRKNRSMFSISLRGSVRTRGDRGTASRFFKNVEDK